MYLKTALEVIVALFCVIGIYAVGRICFQRIFGCKNIVIAVEILSLNDADKAEHIIRRALDAVVPLRSRKITLLTTVELCENKSLTEAAQKYGLKLYVSDG